MCGPFLYTMFGHEGTCVDSFFSRDNDIKKLQLNLFHFSVIVGTFGRCYIELMLCKVTQYEYSCCWCLYNVVCSFFINFFYLCAWNNTAAIDLC